MALISFGTQTTELVRVDAPVKQKRCKMTLINFVHKPSANLHFCQTHVCQLPAGCKLENSREEKLEVSSRFPFLFQIPRNLFHKVQIRPSDS